MIVVVGGGLAGLAAAARLAKLGHTVELVEARNRLGGVWAMRGARGALDPSPAVIGFPAPWRDLFRKSGRPLEAELSRLGRELAPAGPAHYVFADGATLDLPSGRGEQYAAVAAAYGMPVADRWRTLVDRLDEVWQVLRPLGWEAALADPTAIGAAIRLLSPHRTIAQLAAAAPHPHLAAVVRSVAHRLGSSPEVTPAWCAVELSLARTFGRWQVDGGETQLLLTLLERRLATRRVSVHTAARVAGLRIERGRIAGVTLADGRTLDSRTVVCTADPWQLANFLLDPREAPRLRRLSARLRPAHAPLLRATPTPATGPAETVRLTPDGRPTVTYSRASGQVTHDFRRPYQDPCWGVAWTGPIGALHRPPVASERPGLFLAGAASAAGGSPSAVLLSAALAAQAAHDYSQRSVFSR